MKCKPPFTVHLGPIALVHSLLTLRKPITIFSTKCFLSSSSFHFLQSFLKINVLLSLTTFISIVSGDRLQIVVRISLPAEKRLK